MEYIEYIDRRIKEKVWSMWSLEIEELRKRYGVCGVWR